MTTENDRSISSRLFDAKEAECEMEDLLEQAGTKFSGIGWDDYDNSIEIYNVPPDHRLTDKAQEAIYNAGFARAFVNHTDKWETHYTYDQTLPFVAGKGWRVSYPHKRGEEEGKIWVEEDVPTWPREWFKTDYVLIRKPDGQQELHDLIPDR